MTGGGGFVTAAPGSITMSAQAAQLVSFFTFQYLGLKLLNISASLTVRSNFRRVFQDTGGSDGFGVQKRVSWQV